MDKVIKSLTGFICEVCVKRGRSGSLVVPHGDGLRHAKCTPVESDEDEESFDDAMDEHVRTSMGVSAEPCSEDGCTCEGHGGPEHELAAIGWTGAPAPAEVSYWQAQAREAAARHLERSEDDTPFVAALKLSLAEPNGEHAQDAVTALLETKLQEAEVQVDAMSPEPDPFETPASVPVELNVSGQPEARRDYLKRYLVIDPELGDFRRTKKERKPYGITRATTFNKHAQNTIALNGWSKRNVVMGASLRPDILRRAHGLHHDTSPEQREALDRIVDELEKAAGAKVAADEGTFLHGFCDQVDAGLKTWRDAPPAYQQDIKRYTEALAAAGLEPVPGLIERTTLIREFGGVAGTFDRIFYHRPSGQYIVGDLKTGKTMKYAMDETECQIWTYAHGVNTTGVYDWNTDTWVPVGGPMTRGPHPDGVPITVSETVGVIVHMPVQGPEAGEVYLRFADLERGRAYAELNHAVTSYQKSKVRPFEMPFIEATPAEEPWQDAGGGLEVRHSVVMPPEPPSWTERAGSVRTRVEAHALWDEAHAGGVSKEELETIVAFMDAALARVDT